MPVTLYSNVTLYGVHIKCKKMQNLEIWKFWKVQNFYCNSVFLVGCCRGFSIPTLMVSSSCPHKRWGFLILNSSNHWGKIFLFIIREARPYGRCSNTGNQKRVEVI